MSAEFADYFVSLSDVRADPVSWDGFFVPEDEAYDDFLFSGANLYGGY